MRVIQALSVFSIDVDRMPMQRTLDLVKHLERGGAVPPIHVQQIPNGRYRILDGRHRMLAFKLLGRTQILARWGTR